MAMMWPMAIATWCGAALVWCDVTPASTTFISRPDVFSSNRLLERDVPSRIACAALCERHVPGCDGFTYGNGSCRLFSETWATQAPNGSAQAVCHVRPPLVTPCAVGWLFYGNSCYYRHTHSAPADRASARAACMEFGASSDLISLNDEGEGGWLLHHDSRPATMEYIGMRRVDGVLVNDDGSTPSYQPQLLIVGVSNGCINLRHGISVDTLAVLDCNDLVDGYVCEAPLRCVRGTPCPQGWIGVDDHCYRYVSDRANWHAADQQCSSLQSGARLAVIPSMNVWRVLRPHFPAVYKIWIGYSDEASEGSFVSLDGSDLSLTWHNGEPNNKNNEDCVAMLIDAINDVGCGHVFPFVCRVERTVC